MKLSIIIVSYNAWEFLDLTLGSVQSSISGIDCEVIVVDNASKTDIPAKAKSHYPFITTIHNSENLGFSKANNIGLKQAKGELAILLNPDIIVAEDTFEKVIEFYSQNKNTGGLGLKMINGSGEFLKESKRGLPTPITSFYKVSGLCKAFPNSSRFARYYHGNFNMDSEQEVDILSGAFLVQQRDKNGDFTLLNEDYFMYGEDIELSYELKKKFGSNHYFGSCPIIHFKGQSTPNKAEIYNYFYNAMWVFHKKYFKSRSSGLTNFLIWVSIRLIHRYKVFTLRFKRKKQTAYKVDKILLNFRKIELQTKISNIFPDSKIEIITDLSNSLDDSGLVIFDLKSIKAKTIIQQMELLGKHNYAFVSYNNKYLVINSHNSSKGEVIYFKKLPTLS